MFVHIGGTTVIRSQEIIAIFNIEVRGTSPITVDFLKRAQEGSNVEVIDAEETKSVVITRERVYYSPVSSLTLKRRSDAEL